MKEFLSSLLSRDKTPLVGPKAIQSVLRELESLDPRGQVERVQRELKSYLDTQRVADLAAAQALYKLDTGVQVAFETLCDEYTANPRMAKELEGELWRLITGLATRMVEAYDLVISTDDDRLRRTPEYMAILPRMLACGLHYLAIIAKWHYFRFEKAPAKVWSQAHRFYRLSEVEGIDSNPFKLYDAGDRQVTSCADEYIQLLMLSTLSAHNLSVRQLHWSDVWLDQWSKLIQLNRQLQPDRDHYCVNLQEARGPSKIGDEGEGEPFRFWGLFDLLHVVRDALKRLEAGATVGGVGLAGTMASTAAVELLKHLDVFWTMAVRNAQIQRSERHSVNKAAEVLHGFDDICQRVRRDNERNTRQPAETKTQVEYDELVDMRLYGFVSSRTRAKLAHTPNQTIPGMPALGEPWLIQNESDGGFGAVFRYSTNTWVRPGELVAVKMHNDETWQIAVIRRLERQNQEEVYAGLQTLSITPLTVHLRVEGGKQSAMTVTEYNSYESPASFSESTKLALYLPHRGADGSSVNTLIMHTADYATDRLYTIQARDRTFAVTAGAVIEKGVTWVWTSVLAVQ
ncbi:hypothetical protein ACTSKR_07470 [Chitinibacteraceae bacterium HSL-7]